ncbi:MAG TPA: ABC transporter substrate-binding protein [Gaiellaceae bacterium]|nr:ABC transporter substrate-binding protein [Gaiellaceae bacterium]
MRGQIRKAVLGIAALALAAGVFATIGSAAPSKSGKSLAGGTYRVGWEQSFGFTDNFDPTGEYLGNAWALMSNLLIRTLVGYNHVAGAAGNKLVPDLAKSIPHPTHGGTVYTFHLKNGVKFSPPVNRAVTSHDILYAMERLAKPAYGGEYAFYYDETQSGAIKGWHAYATGKAKSIAGIKTPDKSTIVFTLTKPEGDFLYRLAMPATGPIPGEIAKCFKGSKANSYGRDLISSGPYMIQGADQVGKTCATIKPMSGYDGANGTHLILVRNPNYNPATDSKAARENNPDEFDFTIDSNADDIFNKVQAGQLDDEVSSPSPKVLREYVTNPSLKPKLKINGGDRTWYITLNLTQPPFDDIHVRKALNFIMDKASLQKAWGGPTAGSIATHIVPDAMLNNVLKNFDPYASPGHAGSLSKAAAEMKKSKYSGGTGKCTASVCKGVLMIADTRSVDTRMIPVIESSAAKIGITFKVRSVNGAYPVIQTPSKNVPISERPGWGKDYADPSTFFNALFASGSILAQGNTNYSLVGVTPAIAAKVGAKGTVTGVPSVDKDIDKCNAAAGEFRNACWAGVDRKLMTQVVPWVPYLSAFNLNIIGPNVTKWNYDQFSDQTAYAHVAVK